MINYSLSLRIHDKFTTCQTSYSPLIAFIYFLMPDVSFKSPSNTTPTRLSALQLGMTSHRNGTRLKVTSL